MRPMRWEDFRPAVLALGNTLYTRDHVQEKLGIIRGQPNKRWALVTMGTDPPVGDQHALQLPENATWFAQNCWTKMRRMQGIPIGPPWGADNKFENITANVNTPKTKRLFACLSIGNNPGQRVPAMAAAEKVKSATLRPYANNHPKLMGHLEFIKLMAQHEFVLCPPGAHDSDTHRTWEALHLGCVPICKRSPVLDWFVDLPIMFVDDWSELTDAAMDRAKAELEPKWPNCKTMLWTDYWLEKVKRAIA